MTKDSGIVEIHGKQWRSIPGHPTYYASKSGEIMSMKLLKPRTNKSGYEAVQLGRKIGMYVHTLVLLAWDGLRPVGCSASHLNGKRNDNRLANLKWETFKKNVNRQLEHGTRSNGIDRHNARLTEDQVRIIKRVKDPERGWYTSMAWIYGVHANTIRDVHQGRTWRHVK